MSVRGCIAVGAYSYWVAGSKVFRLDSSYTALTLGTIGTSTGEVGMAANTVEILIVDGLSGWLIDLATATLTEIADADFPDGVKRATYQDGFFCVTGDGTQRFYINQTPNVGSGWDGLDFASAEGSPDHTIGIISDHRELWLFGEKSAEVWLNTGNSDFPFERSGNAFVEHGCAAAGTIAKIDNTVFWLGSDDSGAGIVWRADGYTPVRVSTHAIEKAIGGYTLSDAIAFTYQQEGHSFYVLTFPTDSKTWVYDAATQLWHERAWRDPETNTLYRWRPNCHCFVNGEHLVGDFEDGRVYGLDLDTYTDDGDPIKRLRVTQATEYEQKRVFYSSLVIDMETGVGIESGQGSDPMLMVRWSDDGGHTWTDGTTVGIGGVSVGGMGAYGQQVKLSRLGSGRNRVWEISMTDPVKFAVFGAVAKVKVGAH